MYEALVFWCDAVILVVFVQKSEALKDGAKALAERTLEKAGALLDAAPVTRIERAGRKAHHMNGEG